MTVRARWSDQRDPPRDTCPENDGAAVTSMKSLGTPLTVSRTATACVSYSVEPRSVVLPLQALSIEPWDPEQCVDIREPAMSRTVCDDGVRFAR